MRRPLLPLCLLWLLLLLSAGTRAPGKASDGPKTHQGDFFPETLTNAGELLPETPGRIRDTAGWSYDFAPDVRDGPNLYSYVRQNPWSAFDPEGLETLPSVSSLTDPKLAAADLEMIASFGPATSSSAVVTTPTVTTIVTGAAASTAAEDALLLAAMVANYAHNQSGTIPGGPSAQNVVVQSEEEAKKSAPPEPSTDGAGARKGGGGTPRKPDPRDAETDRQIQILKDFKEKQEAAKKLPRFDESKPTYHVNEAHVPGPKFNPNKEVLPSDARDVYKNAVPDSAKNAKNWYGRNADGTIYRYSNANDRTAHFSGSNATKDGIRNITPYARQRLEGK